MTTCKDATELFDSMIEQIRRGQYVRQSEDASSPQQRSTLEAAPFQKFVLLNPRRNFVRCKPVDDVWAAANTLHFFADTEEASILRKYNPRQCDKFLTSDGRWIGAYGAIAMRQIRWCIEKLKQNRWTRRAFVSMGEGHPEDVNRPACWNHIQFLYWNGALHMHVFQRSLNLWNVMPYDCVVLTNVLNVVSELTDTLLGSLEWTIGSLHVVPGFDIRHDYVSSREQMIFSPRMLSEPDTCKFALNHVENYI